jgi:hypothetical protein
MHTRRDVEGHYMLKSKDQALSYDTDPEVERGIEPGTIVTL